MATGVAAVRKPMTVWPEQWPGERNEGRIWRAGEGGAGKVVGAPRPRRTAKRPWMSGFRNPLAQRKRLDVPAAADAILHRQPLGVASACRGEWLGHLRVTLPSMGHGVEERCPRRTGDSRDNPACPGRADQGQQSRWGDSWESQAIYDIALARELHRCWWITIRKSCAFCWTFFFPTGQARRKKKIGSSESSIPLLRSKVCCALSLRTAATRGTR